MPLDIQKLAKFVDLADLLALALDEHVNDYRVLGSIPSVEQQEKMRRYHRELLDEYRLFRGGDANADGGETETSSMQQVQEPEPDEREDPTLPFVPSVFDSM